MVADLYRPVLPKGIIRSAVETLGAAIVRADYPPCSVLPMEADLAGSLRVGRNALREAVKVLAGKGLVRTARRYGTRVCDRAEWNLLDPDVIAWHLLDDAQLARFLFDLTEMRQIIEPNAAALAAARATDAEVAQLLEAAAQLADPDPEVAIRADLAFHTTLLSATHNEVMGRFNVAIRAMLQANFRLSLERLAEPIRYRSNPAQHQAVAEAIAARDPARARAESRRLLDRNREIADQLLADQLHAPPLPSQGSAP